MVIDWSLTGKVPTLVTLIRQEHDVMNSFLRTWFLPDPEKVPRAIVFMSHGFSEHLGLYHSLGNAFQVRVNTYMISVLDEDVGGPSKAYTGKR